MCSGESDAAVSVNSMISKARVVFGVHPEPICTAKASSLYPYKPAFIAPFCKTVDNGFVQPSPLLFKYVNVEASQELSLNSFNSFDSFSPCKSERQREVQCEDLD